jgi:general secretion pathway protein D
MKQMGKWFTVLVVTFLLLHCAVTHWYERESFRLFQSGQYQAAVDYLEEVLRENPDSSDVRILLLRAKMNAYFAHLARARRLRKLEENEKALAEYRKALGLFPDNLRLQQELSDFLNPPADDIPEPSTSSIKPPVDLAVDTSRTIDLHFKNRVAIRQIFHALGRSYGINFIFEKDFMDVPYTYQASALSFFEVLEQLCLVSNTKYRVLGENSVLIYPDNRIKDRTYQLKGVKFFLLRNRKAEDVKKTIVMAFRESNIIVQEDTNLNGLVVNCSYDDLRKVEQLIRDVDKPIGEVEFDIQILEINRGLLNRIGSDLQNQGIDLKLGFTEGDATDIESIPTSGQISDLKNVGFFFNLPTAFFQLLSSSNQSKLIAKPNLHGLNNEQIKFLVGESIPIPETSFSSVAGGGFQNIPTTSYKYKDVGISLEMEPFIHQNDEVTVRVKLEIDFITGYTEEFPLFGKRELECTIRLSQGETAIIGGFIRDEERGIENGLPAISKLPLLGSLFGTKEKQKSQTDIIFSITPQITHRPEIEKDSDVIWTNSSGTNGPDSSSAARPTEEIDRAPADRTATGNRIEISPVRRSVNAGQSAFFSIRLRGDQPIKTLSLSGNLRGGEAIIESLNTSMADNTGNRKIFKHHTENAFHIGINVNESPKPTSLLLGQLKIKFSAAGETRIAINDIRVVGENDEVLDFTSSEALIIVNQQ